MQTRKKSWRKLMIASLFVVVARPGLAQDAEPGQGEYQIGAGDVLEIVVWENAELSRAVPVRPDGWISLPLLNDVRVEGQTPMQLRETLTELLAEFVSNPVVSVVVAQVGSFHVTVLGKVNGQGRYTLNGPTTVLDLLAMAGGPSEFADEDEIYILRSLPSSYQRINFKYSEAITEAGKPLNVELKSGDIVVVP